MLHLFIDAETIGQSVFKSPLLNWSYIIIDWNRFTSDNPYTFEELVETMQFDKFDLQDQLDAGYKYSKSDLQWWLDQPGSKKVLAPSTDDISTEDALNNLLHYVKESGTISRWWTRANCFDPIFIQRIGEDISSSKMKEVNKYIPYWLVRDTRTYIDTRFNFKNKTNGFCPYDDEKEWERVFEKHNSRHDVAADILRIQRIERIINE